MWVIASPELERARVSEPPYTSPIGAMYGLFEIRRPGAVLRVISSGEGRPGDPLTEWEHVSVTVKGIRRCPTWDEMCYVKDLFWSEEETVMQLHPPRSEYVNNHSYCLHMWRPIGQEIPLPPSILTGVKEAGKLV